MNCHRRLFDRPVRTAVAVPAALIAEMNVVPVTTSARGNWLGTSTPGCTPGT
jgi:hypothetical protein